ncbi:MAG TPA: hypothetical protein VNA14_13750 [Mycobacteriales bacterium]|nr:hypothetical protein [Mycobacteriales bacterium]
MFGLSEDRGDIILGWFTKIAIILAVVGVFGFEATSIGVAHVQTQDLAKAAAREGSREWQKSKDVQRAYQVADAVAAAKNGSIDPLNFIVANDGSVTVTVEKEASSVLLFRLGATKKWTEIRETAEAKWIA